MVKRYDYRRNKDARDNLQIPQDTFMNLDICIKTLHNRRLKKEIGDSDSCESESMKNQRPR